MAAKATFDTVNRLIILTEAPIFTAGDPVGRVTFDIEIDGYSDGKEEWLANVGGNFRKNKFPFVTAESAGAALPAGQVEPAFFRMLNDEGWRILPFDADHELTIIGNLVPNEPLLPIIAPRTGRTILVFRDGSQVAQMTTNTVIDAVSQVQELLEIHGQLERSVFIDTEQAINGNGYQQTPFNNITDGVDYAEANGLKRLVFSADATIDRQLKNFIIAGQGRPTLDLNGQIFDKSTFERCTLTGSMQGEIQATECAILNLNDIAGVFLTCSMAGTMTVQSGANLLISRVAPAIAAQPWTLSMNSGQASIASIHNSSGGVIITDMDNAGDILHFNGSQGDITFGATNVLGNAVCSGDVGVNDSLSGGATIDKSRISSELYLDSIT